VFGIHVDAEWRSDMKWQRVAPHLRPLGGRTVLDVGCGNGYYCLRALGAGAKHVVGLEPSPLFVVQFEALRRLLPPLPAYVLPLTFEELPDGVDRFDTVFSMGVLYHRRSALGHLKQLSTRLVSGGQLVLESLTLPGETVDVLEPDGRYANLRNVWVIPSRATLLTWLTEAGFSEPRVVDTTKTTREEQRSTSWMPHYSLADALAPDDETRTVEGYPAPLRSILVAEKP
jgi:tRNA (mo5U34)-methyltransferase